MAESRSALQLVLGLIGAPKSGAVPLSAQHQKTKRDASSAGGADLGRIKVATCIDPPRKMSGGRFQAGGSPTTQ